jgi:AcrR family transcriptional regulator
MKHTRKRQHLLEVASDLFNRLGYRGAGIDQVIDVAGVAKTTLYRHFRTKDDLIVSVLRFIDEQYRNDMRKAVDAIASSPKEKLLATFDFLENWFNDKEFYGCPFMSAAGEYGERSHPVFQETIMHKRLMIAYFEELARAAELDDPQRIAEEINLLHEGAIAVAHIGGDPQTSRKAKSIAATLIAGASADRRALA